MTSGAPACLLSHERYDAVIFDLDGVVTLTAKVHAAAWKRLFDGFLQQRAARTRTMFVPFDLDTDYRRHIDGKPRLDGVRAFLESRGIELPPGRDGDAPDVESLHGLGARKNEYFHATLEERGVDVDESTVALVRALRAGGFRTAIVSSSQNCREVLRVAGLEELFDVRVDGLELARLGLPGKPDPAMFLEAANRLGVHPTRAVVVEDSQAGVEVARLGAFAFVIGVDRRGAPDELRSRGAHVVVSSLGEVALDDGQAPARPNTHALPSALACLDDILRQSLDRRLVVFLDYDGTLTPIVSQPEEALLSAAARRAVDALARGVPVAIVSGRDLRDVQALVDLDHLVYAGSHGFEIVGPAGSGLRRERGREFLAALDQAERQLAVGLEGLAGARLERKRYAIAIHYRNVAPPDVPRLEEVTRQVAVRHPGLRMTGGKKVFELRPGIDWHKGKAVLELLDLLAVGGQVPLPLYIGDDVTDEDAFQAIGDQGIGIVVRDEPRATAARYALDSTDDVRRFLDALTAALANGGKRGAAR